MNENACVRALGDYQRGVQYQQQQWKSASNARVLQRGRAHELREDLMLNPLQLLSNVVLRDSDVAFVSANRQVDIARSAGEKQIHKQSCVQQRIE